jgi:hypothetical protein
MPVPPVVGGYRTSPLCIQRTRVLAAVLLAWVASLVGTAAAADDALARVRTAGELRWGADAQGGAPYVFQDPRDPNHLIGFEVDVADALGRVLGVRARPIQGQWETLLEPRARRLRRGAERHRGHGGEGTDLPSVASVLCRA